MRTIIFYVVFSLFNIAVCGAQTGNEQNIGSNSKKIEHLVKQKEEIVAEEKAALKNEVEKINSQAEKGEISWDEAEELKKEVAKKHALNIENKIAIIDNKISLLTRNEEDEGFAEENKHKTWTFKWGSDDEENSENNGDHDDDYYARTVSELVVAAGLNNALLDGQSIEDSDFKIGGSRFFEIGWAWKTRVFNKSNWLRVKYGVSFQFNGLKPTDNRYFVEDEDETYLAEFEQDLDKSKFRMDNLVIPVHFEFGPSKRYESSKGVKFTTNNMFKIGLGGYAGFNIGERQKLKYEVDGDDRKEKLKNDYNTNDFVYGLSTYIGWGGTSLYAKYDINPILSDPNPELNNFSLGLRFDLD
ncbi:hypothetical protein RM553_05980 [Zunongwangia sp. F363]|uniref:Outer membrane protein beta-barrel domain-containing protein n=1 Tax=Autumnicola tepida TaxID=3075595 RepID=A0ABU3C7R2_9FLAO|nr:hypothetical protein [Zunongwangia sp. F363]MDT0642378.1 hypothetical protein [Zunongwangia sp. F363]